MASFVARLTLALSFIALALAGYSLVQNTLSSPTHTRLNLIPTWLDNTFDSADVLSYLGFGKSSGRLSDSNCVFSAVKEIVDAAITAETRMGASLIRLHFHDCFVDGCDGGILLNDTANFTGEQGAPANSNSVRGFSVIDQAKRNAQTKCADTPVSCADVLAIAARDAFRKFTNQTYNITLGRQDARTANFTGANTQLPAPFDNLSIQTAKFADKGFNQREMVVLAGAHTVGFSRCAVLCTSTNLNQNRSATLQCTCPASANDTGLVGLDPSPGTFDKKYFEELVKGQGLLFSDQELMQSNATVTAVRRYRDATGAFLTDFAAAMVKMSNLPPSAGVQLEIRNVCSRVN
nr:anionic peroxidase [Ipomoea batatas]